jgi:type I restriction enzyme M protein
MQFDMIVANPPFSLKNWGREGWSDDPYGRSGYGVPPASYGDLAFVEHMISTMRPEGGRMAVVMPHGVLFRAGSERTIREQLVEGGFVEAVIGLAPNLFYNTVIPACLWVCRPAVSDKADLLMIDAGGRFAKGASQNELTPDDVDSIICAYRDGADPDGEGGIAVRRVPISEIRDNRFDLTFARYLKPADQETYDVSSVLASLKEAQAELRAAEEEFGERIREAGYEW